MTLNHLTNIQILPIMNKDFAIANITKISLRDLISIQSIDSDKELARRIVANKKDAVNYFLGDFSYPFLEYFAKNILKRDGVFHNGEFCYYITVAAEYFEFIASPIYHNIPGWHKVSLYEAKNDSRLYTYVSTITGRYFNKLREKELKMENKATQLKENFHYEVLSMYDGFSADALLMKDSDEMKWAWSKLDERDQMVLTYTIVEERDSLEIYDLLVPYISQRKEYSDGLSSKRKQNIVALLKIRAKRHLRKLIVKYRNISSK